MVSVHRQLRSSKKMALSATDEFWHSPIIEVEDMSAFTSSSNDDTSVDSNDNSSMEELPLPPAHHQLLSQDPISCEALKGYDHNDETISYDNGDESAYCCRQKVSAVKQQGGGSWLLGFARLSNHTDDKAATTALPHEEEEDDSCHGLLRVPSGASLESDEDSSSDEDDDSTAASSTDDEACLSNKRPRGVSFAPEVRVQPVPHSSTLSPMQRRKMYSSSMEVRQNKIRNKKEYRFDGYDWRNVTEEWEMGVDMVTGELVHPAHEHCP
eukprot:CAMPEP_0183702284 /NCGR_PEP_ID=MMETSP0737-20130205/438_1 /TAXON_ID=385413 /ORGANISM="Thalassiosira miniscula, Strain CCMP1093" /LENGTH=267 /DNA_ID=CAMNT_0025928867 /DNA_START=235 /DNA_END=1038 /DNA_ORIENTATION=-